MRRVVLSVLVLLVAIGFGIGYYSRIRNPERLVLDDRARAAASGAFVQLSAGGTHYALTGPDSGRVVVQVHGFSVPYYIWDSTAAGLARAGYRVLRYDLYGRGYSDRPDVAYDGALYDAQLEGLLDALGIEGKVDLMGLSFGGFVTASFVTHHPSRVRTLTLLDPASTTASLPLSLRLPVVGPWLWQVTRVPGMADNQLSDFLHPERYPTWTDQYRPQMRYRGFGRALLRSVRTLSTVDFDTLYANVATTGVPVLLVWGRQDQTVPFALSHVVRDAIPGLTFFPVDSAGHLPGIEQAAQVTDRLVAFLAAHPE